MALNKYSLRELLELTTETNTDMKYGPDSVRGMTITKEIIPTKANVSNTDLRKFLVVHPHEFVFNPRTHGKKIGFGYNRTDAAFLISWNNIAFRVKPEMKSTVMDEYLFLHFNREEWDREACFRSWGSSTEVFSWDALCEMELQLPPLPIQQKYVDVYNSMLANQQSYERGLEDLKIACEALLEKYKRCAPRSPLGKLISEVDARNVDGKIESVQGVNKDKQFMSSVASGSDILKYKIVSKRQFAVNLMHVGRDVAIPVAMNTGESIIVSPAYTVFEVSDKEVSPEFVLMWLSRSETDRLAWFMSDTNVRSGMEKTRFYEIEIPKPPLAEQNSLVEIFQVMDLRKHINDHLKERIKSMCPILIKGSLEEAGA
jgi:type I restriction enzyme S subunit